eukprot:SAG31_NODE_8773_length_1390_cov_1.314485_2_plen_140_part_00
MDSDRGDGGRLHSAIQQSRTLASFYGPRPSFGLNVSLHDAADASGPTSIHTEAARGQVRSVQRLLAEGVPIEQRDAFGDTALIKAARRGATEVVRLLLEQQADPNAQNDDGYTALMLSVYWGEDQACGARVRLPFAKFS